MIGLDVLHLQAVFVDSTTNDRADIWITPTGWLVSLRYLPEHHESADTEDFRDIYDLGADIAIQPVPGQGEGIAERRGRLLERDGFSIGGSSRVHR